MDLEFLGHAAVAIMANGRTLVVDPYESGQFGGKLAYRPIDVEADWIVCSHDHLDHGAVHAVPSGELVHEGKFGPFEVTRAALFHDEYDGRRRGGKVDALAIRCGEHVVLHLSDVGESPRSDLVERWRGVDVLLIPVGGFYTIGAAQAWEWVERLAPRITIPLHYRTTACSLPLRGLEAFEGWFPDAVVWNSHRIHVQDRLPDHLIVPPRLG